MMDNLQITSEQGQSLIKILHIHVNSISIYVHKPQGKSFSLSFQMISRYICFRIGTSRPALYHVLYDENGFSSDDIQQLTYWVRILK